MWTVDDLKVVCFDFDDTLCIHSERVDKGMFKYLCSMHADNDYWKDSEANLQLKLFMDYLHAQGTKMCLIGGVDSFKEAERKVQWVKEKYGYSLENCCVSKQELKVVELKAIAELGGFYKKQIALVDDMYENLHSAECEGFVALSPMQVVNLFNYSMNVNFLNKNLNHCEQLTRDYEFASQDELRGKYIFWDIDGTLAAYRFNGHVSDPEGTNNGMSLKEIEDGVFLKRKPSCHMQMVLSTCGAKQLIVMGHCQVQKEMDDKQLWLDKYYPSITERLLVSEDKSKADIILQYCKDHDISLRDVVFVDDTIPFLREAERKGIKSFHISSFLDWDFERRQKC